ncbi:MAG TPA: FAD-binding oxidoreductase [Rhodomicrobium sp.]|nr:FAD-binding oxidoreductase [Rhodomicrobium sp.]
MKQAALSLTSRLKELAASELAISDAASLGTYEVDGLRPSAALMPRSAAEVAEILGCASAEGLAVIPTGGKTHLGIGMPPRRYDVAVDLSRMNRILDYEPRDLTLGIEPGVTCAGLHRALAEKGQFLPLAPPFSPRATLGGIVAAGTDTPLRYAHGTARDFLLGIEFVTGEGLSSKSGGRVVKNVTGYDLHKLFVGSLGTLGVMTRLNFRTFPLPPAQRMFVIAFRHLTGAFYFSLAIRKSPLHPRLLETIDPGAARLFAANDADFMNPDSWLVAVEAAGHEAVIERHARDLESMARDARAVAVTVLGEAQRDRLFFCLSEFPQIVRGASPSAVIFRVAALPSAMPALHEKAFALASDHRLNCAILVRALGVVYIALMPPPDAVGLPALIACSRELAALCLSSGGASVIEHCPREIKDATCVWPSPGDEHEIAARLKGVFDPRGILAPGRHRGGI